MYLVVGELYHRKTGKRRGRGGGMGIGTDGGNRALKDGTHRAWSAR